MAEALKTVISQSTECPVCLSTFTDPKILSCSHTFCKACLDNLLECRGNSQIRCPVCRAVTQVPNQDVGKLQVNLSLKILIDDMKGLPQICTNCKSGDKPNADVYCQDCGKYLCTSCLNKHSQWEGFIDHEVIAMSEISSGKVSVRKYRKCRKHPIEDEGCFCSNCRRFTCFRCGVMEHTGEGHKVIGGAAFEDKYMKGIEKLKSKVDKKRSCFQKYIDFMDEEMKIVDNAKKRCTKDIKKAYDGAVRQLTDNRESLQREVKETTEGVEKELESMKTTAQKRISQLTTTAEMVTNRTKIPLDMDTLAAHDTLCEEIKEVFEQEDPEYEQPMKSSKKGNSLCFERNVGVDELGLGKIVNVVVSTVVLPPNKIVNMVNAVAENVDSPTIMQNQRLGRRCRKSYTSRDQANYPPDNYPPDNYPRTITPPGQLPPGQLRHEDNYPPRTIIPRKITPRTSTPRTTTPGQLPPENYLPRTTTPRGQLPPDNYRRGQLPPGKITSPHQDYNPRDKRSAQSHTSVGCTFDGRSSSNI